MANNTTINSELFTKMMGAVQVTAYEQSIARQMVTNFNVPANSGKVIQVPVYASITSAALTEGTAATPADTNTTSIDITLGEYGVGHKITDFVRDTAESDIVGTLANYVGAAMAEQVDRDVFALFENFTASVGAEDAAITVDHIFEAAAQLRANKLTGPMFGVVGPRQALQLKKALYNAGGTVATAASAGDDVLRSGFIGELAGVRLFESSLVKSDLNTNADAELNMVGAVFAPSALGLASRGAMNFRMEEKALERATDMMIYGVKGEAILQDAHGVKIVGSASD